MGRLVYLKDGEKQEEEFLDENKDSYCEKVEDLIKNDYTTIISFNNTLDVDLSKSFNQKDYDNLNKCLELYTKDELDEMRIYNHIIRNGVEDEDVYDYSHVKFIMKAHKNKYPDEYYSLILENRKPIKALDIYARQKIDMLTKEEQEMYFKYAYFDLDFLLFSKNSYLLTINTDNSGFISIFEDDTYRNTNTTDAHSDTRKKQENWYRQKHNKEPLNSIRISIYDGIMVICIPEEINEYQKNELSNTISEVDDLCKFHNKRIMIEAGIENQDGELVETFSSLNEIKEKFVQQKRSKGK